MGSTLMPYIPQERRNQLDPWISGLPAQIETAGDLAYVIYRLMLHYWRRAPSYARWAELCAVNDTVAEFRRRIISEYEDQKMRENGDVTR